MFISRFFQSALPCRMHHKKNACRRIKIEENALLCKRAQFPLQMMLVIHINLNCLFLDMDMTSSIATSSGFSDDNNSYPLDEDVLNYLSTLTPYQQRMLDDFVSINDHTALKLHDQQQQQQQQPPAAIQFAYGNSVGANHFFGRPKSMYEPLNSQIDHEFSSLPPDLVTSSNNDTMDYQFDRKYSYEAEDAEIIETLNEMRDNFDEQNENNYANCVVNKLTFVADVHCNDVEYATVQKPKKHHQSQMITSCESASDPPREKFPKIMTQSCYGQLNSSVDGIWNLNRYEQDLEDESHQNVSSLMTTTTATEDSSIIDGISSINSSIYEKIPSMTSSIETATTGTTTRQRCVKWWDDHREHTEESLQDLQETAEEGE